MSIRVPDQQPVKISLPQLKDRLAEFVCFIKDKDGQPFQSFDSSSYFDREERYKETLYQEARETIRLARWRPEDIGTGRIHSTLIRAIRKDVVHKDDVYPNNLINNWRIKDNFNRLNVRATLERLLFDFYKSKGITDKHVFETFLENGLPYNLIAYLFFIKDRHCFLPISQECFDTIFERIGLPHFKTSRQGSWDNYVAFLGVVKQVQQFLRQEQDRHTTLLDAHSFLWILGNQMRNVDVSGVFIKDSAGSSFSVDNIGALLPEIEPVIIPADEDEETCFPEGREQFRLHRIRERSGTLISKAKETRLLIDPNLCCEVCGFSFYRTYGMRGLGFIEAHHTLPVSQLTEEAETKVADLAMVCSNCHRMLHRRRPWLTAERLKDLLLPGADIA